MRAAITMTVVTTPTRTVFSRYAIRRSSTALTGPAPLSRSVSSGRCAPPLRSSAALRCSLTGRSAIVYHQHDLPELATGREPVVRGGHVAERERGRHRHPHPPLGQQGKDLGLDPPRRNRRLLERAGPQRGPVVPVLVGH